MRSYEVCFLSAQPPAIQIGDTEGETHAGPLFHGAKH